MTHFSLFTRIKPSAVLYGLQAVLILLCMTVSFSELHAEELNIKVISDKLVEFENILQRKQYKLGSLTKMAQEVTDIRGKGSQCVTEFESSKVKTEKLLVSLGDATKNESPEVKSKRQEIKKDLNKIDQQLANCRVLILRSDELLLKVNAASKQLLASQLSVQGPNIVSLIQDNWDKPPLWINATKHFILANSGLEALTNLYWAGLLATLIISIGIGVLIRHYLCERIKIKKWSDDYTSRLSRATIATIAYYAPHLLGSTAAAVFLYQITSTMNPTPFISVVASGLPPYFLFIAIVRLLLCPPKLASIFHGVTEKYTRSLARRLEILAFLILISYWLFATLLSQSLPEPTLLITRAVLFTGLIVNILWAISILMQLPGLKSMRWLKFLIYFLLSAALVFEWVGYRNLSLTLAKDVLGSLLAFGAMLMFSRLFRELYDSLDSGSAGWSKKIRQVSGIKAANKFPGILWLRLITSLFLWGTFIFILLLVWDVSETIGLQIQTYATQGFKVGSLLIVPQKIAGAILTIALIVIIGGWVRNRMENVWLKSTHMERGAREALVTITGYAVVAIAFLTGLGVAGFDFGSLAIIAGALSVGIGFGLQNVVNNFISGLILLFERPVKTGDWIIVGNTEGYVKRIRIRSTQIQTFDSADVIVPNSELISGQVTNWMLHDPRGRARIPVGVAYGSDTQKVKNILEAVANDHPSVVTDGSTPTPKVLFRGFGESSLDFELRCYIHNIDERLHVVSDMNFSIDAAFHENNIEIPFPQRDIHIRKDD